MYGVLAHVSRNRTREMGIRIALGAQAAQVRWLVVRQGLRLTVGRLAVGGVVALFATRAMTKLLFNVAPNDPLTMVGVAVLLAATSMLRGVDSGASRRAAPIRRSRCERISERAQVGGGTRSSGGTKFDRNEALLRRQAASPFALILSRMRFTSSRLTSWTDFGSTRFQFAAALSFATVGVVFARNFFDAARALDPLEVEPAADEAAEVREVGHAAARAVEAAPQRHTPP